MRGVIFAVLLYAILITSIFADGSREYSTEERARLNQALRIWVTDEHQDYFRSLDLAEQVAAFLDMFAPINGIPFAYVIYADILTENIEGVKPVLLQYARTIKPVAANDRIGRRRFIIIDDLISGNIQFFTEEEKNILIEIYTAHLDFYLRTYNTIDVLTFFMDILILRLNGINMEEIPPDYARSLIEKYRELGYVNLEYNL